MPQFSNNQQPISDYPELKLPDGGFKSNIPEHLLKDSDPQMKWLMEKMSENTQMTEWNGHALIDTNLHVRHTNGRLKTAEKEILALKEEILILKEKIKGMAPITITLTKVQGLLSSKIVLFLTFLSTLFLLGYHREVLPNIFKFFFGP